MRQPDVDDEEGEIKVYDNESYIVSDGEMFKYQTSERVVVNWAQIREFSGGMAMFEQSNLYTSLEGKNGTLPGQQPDAASVVLNNLDSMAYADFSQDRNGRQMTPEGAQAIKVMQYAMQYYLFAQKHLTNKVLTLNNYLLTQNAELEKLKKVNSVQRHKLKKQRHMGAKLNDQAIHFEVMIQKNRPDLLEKRGALLPHRKDIRLLDDNDERRTVADILTEQGVLKEGDETLVYDRVAHRKLRDKENQQDNHQDRSDKIDQIFDELLALKASMAKIQGQTIRVDQSQQSFQSQDDLKRVSSHSTHRRRKSEKYSSPARESAQKQKEDPITTSIASAQALGESIRSEIEVAPSKPVIEPAVQESSGKIESSGKLEESATSLNGPRMRRVRNPYGSSDLSVSQKSSQSASQSFQKSKRKIEIEKVSDNDEAADDSYRDDDFEDVMASQKSNEKLKLQQQLYAEKLEKQNQRQRQVNRQSSKLRQGQGQKDATPIKEEDGEDDVSAQDEAERAASAKRKRQRDDPDRAADAFAGFERDSGQEDFAEDMLKIEEASKSATNSVPLDDPSGSTSGTYMPSLVEKARNVGASGSGVQEYQPRLAHITGLGEDSSASFNDESLLRNAQQLHAALHQPAAGSPGRADLGLAGRNAQGSRGKDAYDSSLKNKTGPLSLSNAAGAAGVVAEEEEEEDDEYSNDDFDVEEEDESASLPASQAQPANNLRQAPDHLLKVKAELVDVNVSMSASLLPPLAGGGKAPEGQLGSAQYTAGKGQRRTELKPDNFALNLADSQQSIDFEFSESKTGLSGAMAGFPGNDPGSGNTLNRSKKLLGQLGGATSSKHGNKRDPGEDSGFAASGSMDSHAFDLSESNFSMSKRSGTAQGLDSRQQSKLHQQRQRATEPAKKKEFYKFQGNKFTSYTGDDQSAGGEDQNDHLNNYDDDGF